MKTEQKKVALAQNTCVREGIQSTKVEDICKVHTRIISSVCFRAIPTGYDHLLQLDLFRFIRLDVQREYIPTLFWCRPTFLLAQDCNCRRLSYLVNKISLGNVADIVHSNIKEPLSPPAYMSALSMSGIKEAGAWSQTFVSYHL